jgi:hypothetical protein
MKVSIMKADLKKRNFWGIGTVQEDQLSPWYMNKQQKKVGVVAYTYNLSTQVAGAEGSRVQGQTGI